MDHLVIFDCDGVLVDTEAIINRVRLNILNAAGFPVVEADLRALRGLSAKDAYGTIVMQFGLPLPDDLRDRFRTEFDEHISTGLSPMPGVPALLDRLRAPFCATSNGSHQFMQVTLEASGLVDKFFGHMFSADDVPHPKPHPDLFLYAAAQMKAKPQDCIVIEDSVHGIKAGIAAEMHVIGFSAGGGQDRADDLLAAGAHKVCSTMEEAARHLATLGCLQ